MTIDRPCVVGVQGVVPDWRMVIQYFTNVCGR